MRENFLASADFLPRRLDLTQVCQDVRGSFTQNVYFMRREPLTCGLARLVLFCWAWSVHGGRSRINKSKTTTKKVGYKMIKMIEKVLGQVADFTLGTFDFDISESELVASYGDRARSA